MLNMVKMFCFFSHQVSFQSAFQLIRSGAMKIVDCNNHIKSASAFFGGGCAVNILSDKYNPLGKLIIIFCFIIF